MNNYNEILKLYKKEDLDAYGLTIEDARKAIDQISFQNNDLFRFVFASEDEKSKSILKALASCIIGRPVIDTEIRNSEPVKTSWHQKGCRMDVLARVKDEQGEIIELNLEIQNYGTALQNSVRSQVYMAKLINDQAVQGDRYTQLHKTYQVILCNQMDIFKKLEEYYHEYHYMEVERHEDLPDNRSVIVFFELEKLNALEKKPVEEWSGLKKIGYMLKYSRDPEKRDIIRLLEEKMEVLLMMQEKREDYFKNTIEALSAIREHFDKEQED